MKIEREVKRQLKKPVDARPPSGLLDSIKSDIPEDLFGPTMKSAPGGTAERFRLLPMAASVMTLALVGILAVAVYRQGLPLESVSPAPESSVFEQASGDAAVLNQSEAPESARATDELVDAEKVLKSDQSAAAAEDRVLAQLSADPGFAELDEVMSEEAPPAPKASFEASPVSGASASAATAAPENEQLARKEDDLSERTADVAQPAAPRQRRVAAKSQRLPEPQNAAAPSAAVSVGERADSDLRDLMKSSSDAPELKQSPRPPAAARPAPSAVFAPAESESASEVARARNAASEPQFDDRSPSASKPKAEEVAQDVAAPAPAVSARSRIRTDSRSQGAVRAEELEMRVNLERTVEESVLAMGVGSLRLDEVRPVQGVVGLGRDTSPSVRIRAQLLAGYRLEVALADGTWLSLGADEEDTVDQTIPRSRLALNEGQQVLDLRTVDEESGAGFPMLQRIRSSTEQP